MSSSECTILLQDPRQSSELKSKQQIPLLRRLSTRHRRRSSIASDSTVGRPSIIRTDDRPPLGVSIQEIDALFEQYRRADDDNPLPSPTISTATAVNSDNNDNPLPAANEEPQHHDSLLDGLLETLFPAPSAETKLQHVYFTVATLDGKPAIPYTYACPISLCDKSFMCFENLQAHWMEHPWNRKGVLVPVTAGGIQRLGFWQHKTQFLRAIIDGNTRLLGPRSFLVSPQILSMEKVRKWELERDEQSRF